MLAYRYMNTFSIGDTIKFGWETFKKRPWILIGAMLVVVLIQIALQMVASIPFLGAIVGIVVGVYVGMGLARFTLNAHDNVENVEIRNLLVLHPFWRYVGATVLKTLIAGLPIFIVAFSVGFMSAASNASPRDFPDVGPVAIVLLALSGIWALIAGLYLMFTEYLVIDKNHMPIEAVKESYRITKGNWWKLLGLCLALGLLNVLGALALVIGLLVTVPLTMLAIVHVYRTLEHGASEVVPTAPLAPVTPRT